MKTSAARICPNCGTSNAPDAARCERCGEGLAVAAPPPAAEPVAEGEDRPRRRGPRCPNCGAHMERGTVELNQKMIDFIFTGLSSHSLFFHPVDGRRREVLKPGQQKRALMCPICAGVWIR
ncbi:MAG TPA: zinc ribbon domain-containing protein [Longimicrobium sp.]|jgi:hypothetical protein